MPRTLIISSCPTAIPTRSVATSCALWETSSRTSSTSTISSASDWKRSAVRDALPKARIVVTFHEYLPICHNHGQMVKRPSGQLCNGASPISCHTCFPEIPISRFVRREQFVRGMLNLADAFIAPSAFLANRYVEWGIAAEKIFVIENGIVLGEKTPARELPFSPTAMSSGASLPTRSS